MEKSRLITYYETAESAFLADLRVSSKSTATYEKYSFVLRLFDEWMTANLATTSSETQSEVITPIIITQWKQALAQRGVKVNTIFNYLTVLRAFFKWAVENKFYTEQPVLKSSFPKQEEIKHDVLTLNEIKVILSGKIPHHTPHDLAIRNRAIVIFLMETGLRVSELINLKIKDLDYSGHSVYVDHGKGNKSRRAPFPAHSRFLVSEYLKTCKVKNSEYVFTYIDKKSGKAKQFNRNGVSEMVKGYIERLTGHKNISAHDLRHAAASIWDDKGAPLRTVQKALGHSNVTTTERIYVDILNKSAAAQEISALFPDPFSGKMPKAPTQPAMSSISHSSTTGQEVDAISSFANPKNTNVIPNEKSISLHWLNKGTQQKQLTIADFGV